METHPALAAIGFLIGEWEGEGAGRYPTIEAFTYREQISFVALPGKPFVAYRQKTWRTGDHPESGSPLHTETGYLRPDGVDRAELVLAQPTGIAEIHHGRVTGTSLAITATSVAITRTAKEVVSVERNLTVSEDTMVYEVLLGAVGEPHQVHLEASLSRVS